MLVWLPLLETVFRLPSLVAGAAGADVVMSGCTAGVGAAAVTDGAAVSAV